MIPKIYGLALGAGALALSAALIFLNSEVWSGSTGRSNIAQGKLVYDRLCASCHGVALEGQENWRTRRADGKLPAPPHTVDGHTWHHPDSILFGITKYGLKNIAPEGYQTDMPAFEGILSDYDIKAVISYIRSTWPDDIQKRQQGMGK